MIFQKDEKIQELLQEKHHSSSETGDSVSRIMESFETLKSFIADQYGQVDKKVQVGLLFYGQI